MIIALAAQNRWKIHLIDVNSAFLNQVLEDEVYVDQPLGVWAKSERAPRLQAEDGIIRDVAGQINVTLWGMVVDNVFFLNWYFT